MTVKSAEALENRLEQEDARAQEIADQNAHVAAKAAAEVLARVAKEDDPMTVKTAEVYEKEIYELMQPVPKALVHGLAVAINNFVALKMAEYDYDLAVKHAQEESERLRLEAEKERERTQHDHNYSSLFTVIKIAVLGSVAVFAPPLLSGALPFIGAAGTLSNAIATGAAVSAADAAVQEAAIALDQQDHFSLNEVLECAVSAGVGNVAIGMNVVAQTSTVAAAAAATQVAEMAVGLRDKFEITDVGLQAAAVIVAASIKAAMPGLIEELGGAEAAKLANAAANSAINAVLQSTVTGAPISLENIAESVAGNTIGEKIGKEVVDTVKKPQEESKPEPTEAPKPIEEPKPDFIAPTVEELLKPRFDQMCLINDENYPLPQMTPTEPIPRLDEYYALLVAGKTKEADAWLYERAASNFKSVEVVIPSEEDLPQIPAPNLEPEAPNSSAESAIDNTGAHKNTTYKILEDLVGRKTSEGIQQTKDKVDDLSAKQKENSDDNMFKKIRDTLQNTTPVSKNISDWVNQPSKDWNEVLASAQMQTTVVASEPTLQPTNEGTFINSFSHDFLDEATNPKTLVLSTFDYGKEYVEHHELIEKFATNQELAKNGVLRLEATMSELGYDAYRSTIQEGYAKLLAKYTLDDYLAKVMKLGGTFAPIAEVAFGAKEVCDAPPLDRPRKVYDVTGAIWMGTVVGSLLGGSRLGLFGAIAGGAAGSVIGSHLGKVIYDIMPAPELSEVTNMCP